MFNTQNFDSKRSTFLAFRLQANLLSDDNNDFDGNKDMDGVCSFSCLSFLPEMEKKSYA